MAYTIFVVEDDPIISGSVATCLTRYGYVPVLVQDFRQVEQEFLQANPHLVLMDINLPYQDGYHLTRAIRRHSATPILFVSARAGEMEQVLGIESGGDDYITKPFTLDLLLAKVKAMLRRTYGEYAGHDEARNLIQIGSLQLDLTQAQMRCGEQSQPLTRNELKLLHFLMQRAGRVVSREECLEALWDDASFVDDNTLSVNVTRLRTKLDSLGISDAIQTCRGMGYRLLPERLQPEGTP
ncbi:MAG: response regulator transcription factor [Mycobacterium leprae]